MIDVLGRYALPIFGFVVLLLIGVWAYQARKEAETAKDAGRMVGDKARRATGGIVGFVSAIVIGLAGWMLDAGIALGDVGVLLGDLVANSPQLIAGAVTAVLGYIGISGYISPLQYLGMAFVILGSGAIIAARQDRRGAGA
jgi:hypothetical protein